MAKRKSQRRQVAREQAEFYRTTEAINHFAQREGWALFNSDLFTLSAEIQRIDCPDDGSAPKFDSDQDAIEHCQRLATTSALHKAALEIHDSPSSGDDSGKPAERSEMA